MVRLIFLAAVALSAAGCATSPVNAPTPAPGAGESADRPDLPPPEASSPRAPDAEAPATEPTPRPDPSVSLALRTESARAAASGNRSRAMDLLERAIRIEPERGELWLDLAELHLEGGDAQRARQLLAKAASLARGDRTLERRVRILRQRLTAQTAG